MNAPFDAAYAADFRRVFDALQEPILVIDSDYRICEANAAFCSRYGVLREQVLGSHCYKVTHGYSSACWEKEEECPLKALVDGAPSHRSLHRHVFPDGSTRWEEIVATKLAVAPDGSMLAVEELRDVSELLTTREVLHELKREMRLLEGIVPICCHCHKIRNSIGDWERLETYVRKHTEAAFSHGICPECAQTLYPDL